LHREIHVWFYTSSGDVIFQHRSKDKDTYPDLLDATVGGHVEIDDTYEETAKKEMAEETGIEMDPDNLIILDKIKTRAKDNVTGLINNSFKMEYAYKFDGDISSLQIEEGKSLGFESYNLNQVLEDRSEEFTKKFIPAILEGETLNILNKIKGLIS
jgi:isopentenyldiphosphate isomerase